MNVKRREKLILLERLTERKWYIANDRLNELIAIYQECEEMSDARIKQIALGVEDFKEIIDKGGYFVDKTLMIKELIESQAKVTLFTRPRRFGKTFNQFMIRRFFEDEITEKGEKIDNGHLFDGLKITECGEEIMRHQQQYPVVFMTLKSAKQPTYELAYAELKKRIYEEFGRHQYVLQKGVLSETEELRFREILSLKAEEALYTDALGFLSQCLFKYHGKKAIILIDEYDVPLENAYVQGFYDEMIMFIRSLFESALKTNPYLEKSVITGCLRISRESIFTGLNNLAMESILSINYPGAFGFTEPEVKAMMEYFERADKYPELKKWYDGYCFGKTEIYNPWSILNYLYMGKNDPEYLPRPYWSNTSSNSIVREMVGEAVGETRSELETLMAGGTIKKTIHEEITYADIHQSQDNLWNFLFFTGYLKKINEYYTEEDDICLEMAIPNLEVKKIYRDSIIYWFDKRMKETDRSPLIHALETGDCAAAEDFINRQLAGTISYYDYAENFYHGFMAGLLVNASDYSVKSNRESGNGRPDIVLTELKFMGRAMILELKVSDTVRGMEMKCQEALAQIEEQHYVVSLQDEGYSEIMKYAVCFFKKGCLVRKG